MLSVYEVLVAILTTVLYSKTTTRQVGGLVGTSVY